MKIGVTATRSGLTLDQTKRLQQEFLFVVAAEGSWELHHGDCVGGDETAFQIAARCGAKTFSHPPDKSAFRAFTPSSVVFETKPYRERNQDIVDVSDQMFACPEGPENRYPRSGTWMTVRMARRAGKPILIIFPNGEVVKENWPK